MSQAPAPSSKPQKKDDEVKIIYPKITLEMRKHIQAEYQQWNEEIDQLLTKYHHPLAVKYPDGVSVGLKEKYENIIKRTTKVRDLKGDKSYRIKLNNLKDQIEKVHRLAGSKNYYPITMNGFCQTLYYKVCNDLVYC
jgi:iron-sulfur cluster repair protein YtfE (RIC family)